MPTTARYDGLADWYEDVASSSAAFSRDAIVGLLGQRGGLCLDVGCGTGLYGSMLADSGRDVVGIDVSLDQLRYARSRETVATADATQLPFRDGAFDDVACIWVHGDLDDLPAALAEVARVLREAGIRRTVGVRHRPLAELLNDVLESPLRLLHAEEPRDDPVPAVLALVAERP